MNIKHVLVILLLVVAGSAVAIGKIALPNGNESGKNISPATELCGGRKVGVGVGFQINIGETVCAGGVAIKIERITTSADPFIPEHETGGYRVDLVFTSGSESWAPNFAGLYEKSDPPVPFFYTVFSTDGEDWAEIVLEP